MYGQVWSLLLGRSIRLPAARELRVRAASLLVVVLMAPTAHEATAAPAGAAVEGGIARAPQHTPSWLTFYNTDLDPVRGQQNFSNLIYDRDLAVIDNASRDFDIRGMWSGPWGCQVNVSKVFGEPYCSGPTGLWKGWGGTASWQVGVDWVVAQVKQRPHVVGLFLGDEPELFGVKGTDICALTLYLKQALLAAGRRDVFIYYNDTPNSYQLKHGLCKGLDYFSIDSYNDDPATEVAQVRKRLFLHRAVSFFFCRGRLRTNARKSRTKRGVSLR